MASGAEENQPVRRAVVVDLDKLPDTITQWQAQLLLHKTNVRFTLSNLASAERIFGTASRRATSSPLTTSSKQLWPHVQGKHECKRVRNVNAHGQGRKRGQSREDTRYASEWQRF